MRITILSLTLCFCVNIFAQNFSFGKVSKEELEEKFNPLDSSANAAYLYKYRRTYIQYRQEEGFSLVTEIQERIKIYNQKGFDYATKVIRLHKQSNDEEEVNSLKAYTYNLVNGKEEESKLEKEGIFNTEKSKYTNETKFTMPNIKEGSVIEYKYKIVSPFYWNIDDFEFQHDIPVKNVEALFEAPEYFVFKPISKGFISINPIHEAKRGVIRFNSKERSRYSQTEFQSSELTYTNNTTKFLLSDVPALKDEPYVNNIENYRSAIKYELSYTSFPDSPLKYFATTWEDVVKTIYDSPNFGKELDQDRYYNDEIDLLIANVNEPLKKAALIYDHVKSKIKWNGYYGKFADQGVKRAYLINEGNVAEINLMLTSMLRYAGLNANPVLVSTRHNGIPLFPTIDGYNYVISAIEMSEGTILLDATSNYGVPNILPLRTLNWEGRIIRKDKTSSTINLYPKDISKNVITMLINLSDSGNLEGSVRTIKTSYQAMNYRENYLGTDKNQFLEKLENKYNGLEISDFEVKNDVDVLKPIMESYRFKKESQADIIGGKIYFSPLFFLKTSENPFKLEKREFPVDFGYPSNSRYLVTVNIPQGYKVETIPEPFALMLPDNLGSYKCNISASETNVQLVIDTEIKVPVVSSIYYEALKAYFSKIVEKESEQIVLTKV
ncbi:transglutaminase [Mariniflexile sp. HNIBRBA6329]|uniref:transglutaminase n=1 Tax=Mariniflexile sp. HNIBRBA6329 TaxID=3373088 RepID=UPI0037475B9C